MDPPYKGRLGEGVPVGVGEGLGEGVVEGVDVVMEGVDVVVEIPVGVGEVEGEGPPIRPPEKKITAATMTQAIIIVTYKYLRCNIIIVYVK